MAEKSGFYDRCLFHTTVERTAWDEATGRWTVFTDRGDAMRARFVVLANGILTTPKLARIEGMESFKGESFHTSRWDYNIDLKGKRVGIIGTGATAVQVIPEIAKVVKELYVFQRTPSTIDVRDQRATKPEEIAEWSKTPGWAKARRERLAMISAGRTALQANDDFLAGKVAGLQGAQGLRAPADAGRTAGQAARHELPHHGADPRAGGRDRQGSEDRGSAEALLPVRLQAADLPRRIPADLQPAACDAGRHGAERRRARSTNAASCTTARSIRSTC